MPLLSPVSAYILLKWFITVLINVHCPRYGKIQNNLKHYPWLNTTFKKCYVFTWEVNRRREPYASSFPRGLEDGSQVPNPHLLRERHKAAWELTSSAAGQPDSLRNVMEPGRIRDLPVKPRSPGQNCDLPVKPWSPGWIHDLSVEPQSPGRICDLSVEPWSWLPCEIVQSFLIQLLLQGLE